jgi:CHAT domain-containing protein/Tfp pilus assembly protein PilF
MNSIRYFCLIVVAVFALTPCSASAQLSSTDDLNESVIKLYNEGHFAEAIQLAERLLADPRYDHNIALYNLATLYVKQGRNRDAERAFTQLLGDLDRYDPRVVKALNGLAAAYANEGDYAQAEKRYKEALHIYEEGLRDFAVALNNLAHLPTSQSRTAEYDQQYKQMLGVYDEAVKVLNNLALLYTNQGRYAEAEPLYKLVISIDEGVLSSNGPDYATHLNNLALLYGEQQRYAEAEPLLKKAEQIFEKALGPTHPDYAMMLNNLGDLYKMEGRYNEAQPLYESALAIYEKALGPEHPHVALTLNNLVGLLNYQGRYADALPIVRKTISNRVAATWAAFPTLQGAQAANLISRDQAIEDGFSVMQQASQTAAGEALNALAVRFSAGSDELAMLVHEDQNLAVELASRYQNIINIIAARAKIPEKGDTEGEEQRIRKSIAAIIKERKDLEEVLAHKFPKYAALSNPQTLTVKDIQGAPLVGEEQLLADDEALVVLYLGTEKSYVWAITHNSADWKELALTSEEISKRVTALRAGLDFHSLKPFDAQVSFELYRAILAPIEELLKDKPRLSLVLDGALTSLPPQVLVTRDPTGKALKDVDWLIRKHAITILPSVASLKVLRGKSAIAEAPKPLVGFADPVFDRDPQQLKNVRLAANVAPTLGIRGAVAELADLKKALPPLPETATELRKVATSVHADPASLFIGADATETRVKEEKLDQFRIVYFATHGLLAGDVADFAKLNAEPALVLSLPEHPTDFDDGLLTASQIAQLILNADWVVLSACNTASADKPGAEALSGLARAFFYAGARSLVVSNWAVNSESAVALMTDTFAELSADPTLSHAEALRKSMLAMIDNSQHPLWADPIYWAPFVVVGEPAKPTN